MLERIVIWLRSYFARLESKERERNLDPFLARGTWTEHDYEKVENKNLVILEKNPPNYT